MIVVGTNRLGTLSKNITCYNERTIYWEISEPIEGEVETFVLSTASDTTDILDFDVKNLNDEVYSLTISPQNIGTDTIIIKSKNTTDQLHIVVNVVEEPKDRVELNAEEIYSKCGPATVEILATTDIGTEYTGIDVPYTFIVGYTVAD